MTKTLHIKGMHCASCKDVIEDICHDVVGIASCNVNTENGEVAVDYEHEDNLVELKKEIDALGQYTVELT
ncbi:MAG: cation transporter [Candidatus Uhrbacteria bacterium]|nr:cation transporter [Candidatus Uhrbacteria bacterium]